MKDTALKHAMMAVAVFEAAMTQEWDMILLDLMLPELDGFEVARRLRNETNTYYYHDSP
jgi:DNA-binding response OmpR family regulator